MIKSLKSAFVVLLLGGCSSGYGTYKSTYSSSYSSANAYETEEYNWKKDPACKQIRRLKTQMTAASIGHSTFSKPSGTQCETNGTYYGGMYDATTSCTYHDHEAQNQRFERQMLHAQSRLDQLRDENPQCMN